MPGRLRSDTGQVFPALLAFVVSVLVLGLAFVLVGIVASLRAEAQTASDAAAVAGAENLGAQLRSQWRRGRLDPSRLSDRSMARAAQTYADRNGGIVVDFKREKSDIVVTVQSEAEFEAADRPGRHGRAESQARARTTVAASNQGDMTFSTRLVPLDSEPAELFAGVMVGAEGVICPVAGPTSFSDSWGAPRSGDRSHKGADMFAGWGVPLVAVEDGVVIRARSGGGLGGVTITMRGDSGHVYYYAHNSKNSVSAGRRVSAGQVIGFVGDTGNAKGTSPHLHFEIRPEGGAAVNPTPSVALWCAQNRT